MNNLNLPSTLDVSRLLLLHSGLSCVLQASHSSPSYSLPIALFGLYAVEKSSTEGLRQFAALHALSLVLDILWLMSGSRETGKIMTLIFLINMFAKPVTLLAVSANFKQQGLPTVGPISVGGQGGTTVWSADESQGYQIPYHRDLGEEDEDDLGQPAPTKSVPSAASNGHKKKESQSSTSGGYHTIA